ncbi:hypothetical protein DCAR_0417198 [Daucus carota subsp. sativus]|uniref:Uncharacterized protein n=1 Tax=Daucus carota subsp. sativus TaxID=79200 RepID=A0A165Y6E5_DAUCS|nr:hypothetical protein DCAR_0417198 [Daucus carota subsp. sativus]
MDASVQKEGLSSTCLCVVDSELVIAESLRLESLKRRGGGENLENNDGEARVMC